MTIATRLAAAKITHATSIQVSERGQIRRSALIHAIPLSPHGRDGIRTELRPQASDAHVEDVRGRIELEAPHCFQELLLGEGDSRMAHELLQEQELPLGERDRSPPRVGLASQHVQTKMA